MITRLVQILIFTIASIFTGGHLYGQSVKIKDVLDKATTFYTTKNQYRIDMKFTMYRGFSGNNKTESYTGIMERNGDYMKNSILNTTIYQYPKSKIIIDDDVKTLTYTLVDMQSLQNVPVDLNIFLEYYKESQVIDGGKVWICEMVYVDEKILAPPYGKVVLYIDKKDYSIQKQELFFSNRIPFKSKKGNEIEQDYGRLVITLSHDMNVTITPKNQSDFISVNNSNSIRLSETYSSYQLINSTTNNN